MDSIYSYSSSIAVILSALFLLSTNAQLSPTFYDASCPNALPTIRTSIRQAVSHDRRMAGLLIRLHFHDCFVQGCDASILLDETPTMQTEKTAFPNNNSVRGYGVIEAAKRQVERICSGVVSCADVLTVAARDASVAVGGPSWSVKLGRRDSTTAASHSVANSYLPNPFVGSHTIGQSQCEFFRRRIYSNGTDIDAGFASTRRRQCPANGGNSNLAPLDLVTPNTFDNNFFKNLMQREGVCFIRTKSCSAEDQQTASFQNTVGTHELSCPILRVL